MAIHASMLAWKIPCTEEPGRLTFHGVTKSWKTEQLTLLLKETNVSIVGFLGSAWGHLSWEQCFNLKKKKKKSYIPGPMTIWQERQFNHVSSILGKGNLILPNRMWFCFPWPSIPKRSNSGNERGLC